MSQLFTSGGQSIGEGVWLKPMTQKKKKKATHMVDPHYLWICIGEFAYLLKYIFNLQINQCSHAFIVTYRHAEWWKFIPGCACSQLRLNKVTLSLPSCSSSHTTNKRPFQGVFKCQNFSFFLCFWLVIILFKIIPNHSTEVLSRVPKSKKAMMCLLEHNCVLVYLHSGVSHSAAGLEFNDTNTIFEICLYKEIWHIVNHL